MQMNSLKSQIDMNNDSTPSALSRITRSCTTTSSTTTDNQQHHSYFLRNRKRDTDSSLDTVQHNDETIDIDQDIASSCFHQNTRGDCLINSHSLIDKSIVHYDRDDEENEIDQKEDDESSIVLPSSKKMKPNSPYQDKHVIDNDTKEDEATQTPSIHDNDEQILTLNHDNSSTIISHSSSTSTTRETTTSSASLFDMLCDELISEIMNYFSQNRQLMNFVYSSKRFPPLLTYKHVIRTAVFDTCSDSIHLKTLISNISTKKSLFVPSVFRLLRLVNGKRCERGEDCYDYNSIKGISAKVGRGYRPYYGLYICGICTRMMTSVCSRERDQILNYSMREDQTINIENHSTVRDIFKEKVSNDNVGPVFSMLDLRQVIKTYDFSYYEDWRKVNDESNRDLKAIRYDELVKRVMTRLEPDIYESKRNTILDLYNEAEDDYQLHLLKIMKRWQKKDDARNQKRLARLKDAQSRLYSALGDFEYKEFASNCTFIEDGGYFKGGYSVGVEYTCAATEYFMMALNEAPSSVNTKKIVHVADKIINFFDLLEEKHFFRFEYLNQQDPFEKQVYESCIEEGTENMMKRLLSAQKFPEEEHFSKFLDMVTDDEFSDAFYFAMDRNDEIFVNAFAMSTDIGSDFPEGFDEVDFRRLCETVWKSVYTIYSTSNNFSVKINRCREKYREVSKNAIDYLNFNLTKQFLSVPDYSGYHGGISRLEAVRSSLFTSSHDLRLLESRSFVLLLEKHSDHYRNQG